MDTQLVVRAQQGDEAAFADLMARVSGRLIKLAYGILRDPGTAEDATQQALVTIWKKLPTLRDPSRFDGWSYRSFRSSSAKRLCVAASHGFPAGSA